MYVLCFPFVIVKNCPECEAQIKFISIAKKQLIEVSAADCGVWLILVKCTCSEFCNLYKKNHFFLFLCFLWVQLLVVISKVMMKQTEYTTGL